MPYPLSYPKRNDLRNLSLLLLLSTLRVCSTYPVAAKHAKVMLNHNPILADTDGQVQLGLLCNPRSELNYSRSEERLQ